MALTLTSNAFQDQHEIPAHYTCQGADVSPALAWAGAPAGTASYALIVDDPDAPDPAAPKRVWVHWLLYNLPANSAALAEGIRPAALPPGTREGRNDWQRAGYGGPCPPIGRHRYFFKLYALRTLLPDLHLPDKAALVQAIQGLVLAEAQLIGTYQKN